MPRMHAAAMLSIASGTQEPNGAEQLAIGTSFVYCSFRVACAAHADSAGAQPAPSWMCLYCAQACARICNRQPNHRFRWLDAMLHCLHHEDWVSLPCIDV